MISSNPGLLTRGTGPLYTQMLTARRAPFKLGNSSHRMRSWQGCLGSKLIHWLKRPDEGASTAIMTYRHPTLFWRKERLCCEYVLSLPSSELPLSLSQGPRPHNTEGSPGFRPWSSLAARVLASAGQAAAARARGPSGATVKPPARPDKEQLEAFRASRATSCIAFVRAGRRVVRACTPRCHKQQQTSTPSQLTVHKSALFYFRRFVADYACTPLLSRDRHQQQLPVRP